LIKRSKHLKTWTRRYFVLLPTQLIYYHKLSDVSADRPGGCFPLCSTSWAGLDPRYDHTFVLKSGGRNYLLAALSEHECSDWLVTLRRIIAATQPLSPANNNNNNNYNYNTMPARRKATDVQYPPPSSRSHRSLSHPNLDPNTSPEQNSIDVINNPNNPRSPRGSDILQLSPREGLRVRSRTSSSSGGVHSDAHSTTSVSDFGSPKSLSVNNSRKGSSNDWVRSSSSNVVAVFGTCEHQQPLMVPHAVKEGILFRRSKHLKLWALRYFAIVGDQMLCFLSMEDAARNLPKQGIPISRHMRVGKSEGLASRKYSWWVDSGSKTLTLASDCERDRISWMHALQTLIEWRRAHQDEDVEDFVYDQDEGVKQHARSRTNLT
jgi:hypothetical protein